MAGLVGAKKRAAGEVRGIWLIARIEARGHVVDSGVVQHAELDQLGDQRLGEGVGGHRGNLRVEQPLRQHLCLELDVRLIDIGLAIALPPDVVDEP